MPSGSPEARKSATSFGGLAAPVGIAERDHVVDRPGIVGDDIGQDETVDALGMLDGHDQGNAAAGVMADEACAGETETDP